MFAAEELEPPGERLLLIGDPAEDLPAARYEAEALAQTLSQPPRPLALDLRLGRLRRADLLRIFKSFRLLHFAGHAEAGGWRLWDGLLTPEALSTLAGGRVPQLVFANACRSAQAQMGPALLGLGVQHFIGSVVDLSDLPGAEFAERFYRGLRAGAPIGEALRLARCGGEGAAWAAYELLGDPNTRYFEAPQAQSSQGVRRAVVLALRIPWEHGRPETLAEIRLQQRLELRAQIEAEGGCLLPGGSVARGIFGWESRSEEDGARALRCAEALRLRWPKATLTLGLGALMELDGVPDGAPLWEAEEQSMRQEPGIWGLPPLRALGLDLRWGEGEPAPFMGHRPRPVEPLLVGRGEEIRRLLAWAEMALQEPQAVTLLGAAGVGKSRLISALSVQLSGFRQLRGEAGAGQPFGAVAALLRALLAEEGLEPSREGLQSLIQSLTQPEEPDFLSIDALLESQQAAPLEERLEALAAAAALPSLGAEGAPGEVAVACRILVETLARQGPLLLIFEDLQQLSSSDRRVIEALMTELQEGSVLVLASARDELLEQSPRWFDGGHIHRLDLGPLKEAEARALLRQLLPEISEEILRRAEGIPLFIRELALAQREDPEPLPATIEAVIQARLDHLSPELQGVLRAASVLGRTFWSEGLSRLLQRALDGELQILERQGFLLPDLCSELPEQSQWRFAHTLVWEGVQASLTRRERQAWHARAALWLADELGGEWARVARHRSQAGDPARAAEDWLRAAKQARYAPEAVRKALRAALVEDDQARSFSGQRRAEIETELAEGERTAGELDNALRLLNAALKRGGTGAQRAARLRSKAEVLEAQGARGLARELLIEALALLSDEDQEAKLRARIHLDLAWLAHQEGDLEGARCALMLLLPKAEGLERGEIYNRLGVVAYGRGEHREAERRYTQALEIFENFGAQKRLALLYNNLGILAVRRGDFAEGIRCHQRALKLKADRGDRGGLARAYNNLGSLYGEKGDFQRAARFLKESIRIRKRIGHSGLAVSYANLGEVYFHLGEWHQARQRLEAAIALCELGRGPGYLLPDLCRMLAELERAQEDLTAALSWATRALSLASAAGDRPRAGVARRVLAEILLASGEEHKAQVHLHTALKLLAEQPLELERVKALLHP